MQKMDYLEKIAPSKVSRTSSLKYPSNQKRIYYYGRTCRQAHNRRRTQLTEFHNNSIKC